MSRWFPIAEIVVLVLMVLGLVRFLIAGEVAFLAVMLVLALLLNPVNRLQNDRRSLRRALGELRQLRLDLTEELEAQRQLLQRQSAGGFSQLQSSQDLELAMVQLRLQNARLDQSLEQVVSALNDLLPQPVDLPAKAGAEEAALGADRSAQSIPPVSPTIPSTSSTPSTPNLTPPPLSPSTDGTLEPSLPSFATKPASTQPASTQPASTQPAPTSHPETPFDLFPEASPEPPEQPAALGPIAGPAVTGQEIANQSADFQAVPIEDLDEGTEVTDTTAQPLIPPDSAAVDQIPPDSAPGTKEAAPFDRIPVPQPWQEALSWQQGLSFVAHSGWVNAMALSADGQRLVTGGTDQQIRIWQLPEGKLQAEWSTPSPISALAFSPDNRLLASGNYDHRIQIWDLQDERLIKTLEGHYGSVKALAFFIDPLLAKLQAIGEETDPSASPNLSLGLISGSYDQTLRIWDLQRGGSDRLEGHEGSVQTLSLSPQQDCAISGGEEGHLRLWRLPDGQTLDVLTANSSAVEALALSRDGSTLASGCSNGSLYLWHLPSRTPRYGIEGHTGPVTALALTPDGQTLISGGADGRLKLWHVPTGQPQGNLADPIDAILNLALSPSGQLLISSHPGGQIQLWWRQETPYL
ncbi:MAG: hypothetical protein ACO34J_09570 [Prochlorothrix sp.]